MLGQNVLEAFLITYKTRRTSIKHSTAVLRMLDMCPESSVPRRALLDHFIERSVIFWEEPENDEDDMFTDTSIRKLELDWASSLLKNLNQIGKQSTAMAVRNQRLMGALEEICNRKNSYNFTLGVDAIKKALIAKRQKLRRTLEDKNLWQVSRQLDLLSFIRRMLMLLKKQTKEKKKDDKIQKGIRNGRNRKPAR